MIKNFFYDDIGGVMFKANLETWSLDVTALKYDETISIKFNTDTILKKFLLDMESNQAYYIVKANLDKFFNAPKATALDLSDIVTV
jgi:hypothetical protein